MDSIKGTRTPEQMLDIELDKGITLRSENKKLREIVLIYSNSNNVYPLDLTSEHKIFMRELYKEETQVSGQKCPNCGQVDEGQTGEYPCPECGLPGLHDEPEKSE